VYVAKTFYGANRKRRNQTSVGGHGSPHYKGRSDWACAVSVELITLEEPLSVRSVEFLCISSW